MLEISLVVFGNLTIVSKKNTNADIVKIFATSVLTTAKCWSWVRLKILELKVRRSQKKSLVPSILSKQMQNFGTHVESWTSPLFYTRFHTLCTFMDHGQWSTIVHKLFFLHFEKSHVESWTHKDKKIMSYRTRYCVNWVHDCT